jgi:hypothetical protein
VVLSLDRSEADAPSHFGLRVDGKPTGIVLTASPSQSVWSPETYVAIVHGLTPGLKPDPTPADPQLVASLTDGRVETSAGAARQVSTALSAHRRAPALHEASALILTALALREGNRHFDDPRTLLARAAAHLAVADALRGRGANQPPPADASTEGRLARATLAGLAGRQVEALALVAALRQTPPSPAVQSWLRAIEIRTRLDWRVLLDPSKATLVERLQHARALAARRDVDDVLAFADRGQAEEVADWSRVLLTRGFSVEAGNVYARDAIGLELAEASAVHRVVRGAPLDRQTLVAALNQPPSRGPRAAGTDRVEVIDWPLWADVLQRHLADALLTYSMHLRGKVALIEEAAEYEKAVAGPFGTLRLFPFVNGFFAQQDTFPAAMAALHPSWERPELVPPHAWLMTLERITRSRTPSIVLAPAEKWFAPVVPLGTAPEDIGWRTHAQLGEPVDERAANLERWRALAPYKRQLAIDALTLTYGSRIPLEAATQALRPFVDYDVRALGEIGAATEDPAGREAIYRRMCELTAEQCGPLASWLVDQERDDKAAVVYRRFIGESRDRVLAANRSGWLVDYEYTHGRSAEAWRLATDAAETYSGTGLAILAGLSERTGALAKAEDLYQKIAERYKQEASLLSFYLRVQATGDARYAAAAAPIAAKLFPQGLQRVGVADFTTGTPPDRGLSVEGPGRRLAAAGVRGGDILVALDGYRVRTEDQYDVVWRLSKDPAMTFIVYRNGSYLAATGRFPRRAIADNLREWTRPAVASPRAGR